VSGRLPLTVVNFPTAGLYTMNVNSDDGFRVADEEPDLFDQVVGDFLARVDARRWPARDPRSISPKP